MDKYNLVCDYLQEAVNLGTMSEEEAAVLEAAAAERYGIEDEEITESSTEDDTNEEIDAKEIIEAFQEQYSNDLLEAVLEATADTTEQAEIKGYNETMKELIGAYKNNIASVKKALKASNVKEAKNQLKDAKVALTKMEVATQKLPDKSPAGLYKAVFAGIAGLSLVWANKSREYAKKINEQRKVALKSKEAADKAASTFNIKDELDWQKNAKKAVKRNNELLGVAIVGGAINLSNALTYSKFAKEITTKREALLFLKHCKADIAKIEKKIDNLK